MNKGEIVKSKRIFRSLWYMVFPFISLYTIRNCMDDVLISKHVTVISQHIFWYSFQAGSIWVLRLIFFFKFPTPGRYRPITTGPSASVLSTILPWLPTQNNLIKSHKNVLSLITSIMHNQTKIILLM